MPPVHLPVTRIEQQPGLCGAATAQMILHFRGAIGTASSDQLSLWETIQGHTTGTRPEGPINRHDCPSWPTQECNKCDGVDVFTCWCSYPPALEATLVESGQRVRLTAHALDTDAAADIIRSIDASVPAAVLVRNGLHWLVVAGYSVSETPGTGRLVDGRWIYEIYVRNPAEGASNQSVGIAVWMREYLSPVIQCGDYLNSCPVIAARPGSRDG